MKYKVVDYLENIIKFDKKHTQVIKGLAILFMVLHHVGSLYYNQIDLSWYARNSRDVPEMILLFFSTGGKVCVSLFTIMSGFGLAKSYGRYSQKRSSVGGDVRFILAHLIQFYSIYWIAFLLRLGMQCYTPDRFQQVFGSDSAAVLRFIAGFFGLSTLFNLRGLCDWFVTAIIILYLVFPLLYRMGKHLRYGLIVIGAVPWVVRWFIPTMHVDTVLFCLMSFATGIILAQTDLLDKLCALKGLKVKIISAVAVIAAFGLRLIFSLYADWFFALTLIVFCTLVLSETKGVNRFLMLFGSHSANIWLLHVAILRLINELLTLPVLLRYIVVLAAALCISLLLEWIKKKTKYNTLIRKLRQHVEAECLGCQCGFG